MTTESQYQIHSLFYFFLEQETLSSLLRTGWFQDRIQA